MEISRPQTMLIGYRVLRQGDATRRENHISKKNNETS